MTKQQPKKIMAYSIGALCLLIAVFLLIGIIQTPTENFEDPNAPIAKEAQQNPHAEQITNFRLRLADALGPYLLHGQWLDQVEISDGQEKSKIHVQYTLDAELQKNADKLLRSYKPDYGAIVMMDASTGRILALSSFQKTDQNAPNLALRGTFPAASVFKIVTATAALDKHNVTPDTIVQFNGGNHTLYKKNVMSNTINRWTRGITLREAFARSINTVFGRLTLERLEPNDLEEYALRFGFNKTIQSDLPFDSGFTEIPKEKSFHLTELASGYNKITRMSPIQGAMIAASVANNGIMKVPYIVENAKDEHGKVIFQSEPIIAAVTMSPQAVEKLKELMEATITSGTSRKSFRTLVKDKKLQELVLGGKTGSLTGDNPKGKVDWFVGYAINDKQKIAVAALTVNVEHWVVKSSYMAQSLLRGHFKEQFTKSNETFFNASIDREPSSHNN